MAYLRKTVDVWLIEGNFAAVHGWEELSRYESRKEAQIDLKEYCMAAYGSSYRIVCRREAIERPVPTGWAVIEGGETA